MLPQVLPLALRAFRSATIGAYCAAMRALVTLSAVLSIPVVAVSPAFADDPTSGTSAGGPNTVTDTFARETPPDDPTGGAYTPPTLLFTPAAAVPTWNVRVITSLDIQGPAAPDKLATGTCGNNACAGLLPGIGGELGLPGGFTFAAGTVWVGGDTVDYRGAVSPFFQLRYHISGNKNGQGLQLGTSATYKFVGFGTNQGMPGQDPGEMELAFSSQYREAAYEVGLEGVIGKDFATVAADGEIKAYAVYRVIPRLAIGAAAQLRLAIVQPPGGPQPFGDVIAGGIASFTYGRWQFGALAGMSTVQLNVGSTVNAGALAEVFATARI
jgi:hypothetical protein